MENIKKQILIIPGGDIFDTYDEYLNFLKNCDIDIEKIKRGNWRNNLQKNLGDEFEVICPTMPNKNNAKYSEWKIWFERLFPFLREEAILIGSSLGAIFLTKYLSENILPIKIKAVFLVAPPFDDETKESLGDFKLLGTLERFREQVKNIFIFHSKDDPVVPFYELDKYSKSLPDAEKIIFENRGHFNKDKEFPELVEIIKSLK